MLRVTDAERGLREVTGTVLRLAPSGDDLGTLLAVDTLARTAEVMRMRVLAVGVAGVPELNVRPANASGQARCCRYEKTFCSVFPPSST